jgi:hypothetical protein
VLIDENMPVIIIMTQDSLYPKVQSAFAQITARKAQPIVLCNEGDEGIPAGAKTIRVPKTIDCLQGLLNIISLQLLSYQSDLVSGALTDSLSSSSGLACVQPNIVVLVTVESGTEHERSGNESEPLVSGFAAVLGLGLKTKDKEGGAAAIYF